MGGGLERDFNGAKHTCREEGDSDMSAKPNRATQSKAGEAGGGTR